MSVERRIGTNWYAVITPAVDDEGDTYWVNFEVFELDGLTPDDRPLFHKKDSPSHPDPVDSWEQSESYATGSVKWDGCSNWSIDENDRCMLHFCAIPDLGEMMEGVFRFCAEQMPDKMIQDYVT